MYTLAHTHVCVCMPECVYTHTHLEVMWITLSLLQGLLVPRVTGGILELHGLPYATAMMVQRSRTALGH